VALALLECTLYASGVQVHHQEQSMKQARQPAPVQSGSKLSPLDVVAGKNKPVPLSDTMLKQVVGGVKPVSTLTPHEKW
jgi:hypothetical protein